MKLSTDKYFYTSSSEISDIGHCPSVSYISTCFYVHTLFRLKSSGNHLHFNWKPVLNLNRIHSSNIHSERVYHQVFLIM